MDIQGVQAICRELNGTTEDVKWGNHLTFNVCEKMYTIVGVNEGSPNTLCFKSTAEQAEQLIQLDGLVRAPYLGRYHWVLLEHLDALGPPVLAEYIQDSYRLVVSKLTKKQRAGLV